MTDKTTIATFDDLVKIARANLLDGIIAGEPFASTVGGILITASAFGHDEAQRSASFWASIKVDTFEDLKRAVVEEAVNDLFASQKLAKIAHDICTSGAAFGFRNGKKLAA